MLAWLSKRDMSLELIAVAERPTAGTRASQCAR